MKKIVYQAVIVIMVITLNACAKATPEYIEGMINPGDEIDGMVFTTTDEVDWNNSLSFLCLNEDIDETATQAPIPCFATPGSNIFLGSCNGILFDTEKEAKKRWDDFKLEITFDNQEINLPTFGFIETEAYGYEEKYLRMWNLKIENIKPGLHTIVCVSESNSEDSRTFTYNFTVSDKSETFPILSEEVFPYIQLYTSEKANLNYVIYIPGEYGVNPKREWPLILYLHGGDRVNSSVRILKNEYLLSTLEHQDYFPFIVVAPQGKGAYEFWATDEMIDSIMALLEEIQSVLSVDANQIYLTGPSAGGNGTWEIGLRHPDRFAALAPVMGYYGWPFAVPENICDLADVPIWAYHGETDDKIPLEAEQNLIDALEACGGDVQMTVFPDVGHDLSAESVYTSELYKWFLEQKKK
jgi:predicted esterase